MCCIASEPIEDPRGRIRTWDGPNKFQTDMMSAPYQSCNNCLWFGGQFMPYTCGCTQYMLRKKALQGDMTKYICCQGFYPKCCCFEPGNCGEQSCPELCLCTEAWCCNGAAISSTRAFVATKYGLQSDPCDYRLIRISNCLLMITCICDILALIDSNFREIARIIDWIYDIFYHCVTGCMTAQVAQELNYQYSFEGQSGSNINDLHNKNNNYGNDISPVQATPVGGENEYYPPTALPQKKY